MKSQIFSQVFIGLSVYLLSSLSVEAGRLPIMNPHLSKKPTTDSMTEKEKISYSLGASLGNNFKRQSVILDVEAFTQGIQDVIDERPLKLSETEILELLRVFQERTLERLNQGKAKAALKNQQEGQAFLTRNKNRPEVITLPSGLQYEVLRKGQGANPSAKSEVVTHYRGTLLNGTEFDSSYKRGQPAIFELDAVIEGWKEALQKMKVGAIWKLYIPPELAYGETGIGEHIGPQQTLVFEIELISIK